MNTKEEILQNCKVEGNVIKLPDAKLDRKTYLDVAKHIERIGGSWNRKANGFVFQINPTELLQQIVDGEKINLKKEFQFFPTPNEIAKHLVGLADLEPKDSILEPSAGQGAIIKAINQAGFSCDCYELMETNRIVLQNTSLKFNLIGDDFLKHNNKKYNKIIANPPFSKNQDIEHIMKMYDFLEEGGRIVCISSKSATDGTQQKQIEFQNFLRKNEAQIIEIERGAFSESGTMVASNIIIINKMKATIINRPNPDNPKIIILPELRDLIRPLSEKEFTQLEENILAEGIRDKLIIWKRGEEHILVDGHNRFSISQKHGLDFVYVERKFKDIDEVKEWMINNQLGKRNLTENEISYLRGLQYKQMKNTHGGDRKTENSTAHNEPLKNTAEKLAETHKVSPATIKRDEEYADQLDKISGFGSDLFKFKVLNKEIDIPKKKLKEISELPLVQISDIVEGLEAGKPLSDLLPKTEVKGQPLPEESEKNFEEFAKKIETGLEKIAGKHTDFGKIVETETPKETEIEEISEVYEWKNGYYQCYSEEYQNTIYVDCVDGKFQMVEYSAKYERYKIASPLEEELPYFSKFVEITGMEYRDMFQAALQYFGVYQNNSLEFDRLKINIKTYKELVEGYQEQIKELKASLQVKESSQKIQDNAYQDINALQEKIETLQYNIQQLESSLKLKENFTIKDEYTDEDVTNKEMQKEFFGTYSEIPVPFKSGYLAIPASQYYYFRAFIDYVCRIKEDSELEESSQKINALYFVSNLSSLTLQNKLHEAIYQYLIEFNRVLIDDKPKFIQTITEKVIELNKQHSRCKPLKVDYWNLDGYLREEKTGFGLQIGEVFTFIVHKINSSK